jgi:hypothetical protein
LIIFGFPGHPSLKKGGESLTYKSRIINHPVPEIEIAIFDYIWISGPPLLEKRRGEFNIQIPNNQPPRPGDRDCYI